MPERSPRNTPAFSSRRRARRGLVAVEFALTSVFLFLFVFASIEFGRALLAIHSLEEAARAACRVAILNGTSISDVDAEIDRVLGASGISNYTRTVTPTAFGNVAQWQPVSIELSANYSEISWLPLPRFLADITLEGGCTLPRESRPANSL